MAFRKATKKQSKLRCAVFGPSGSGKTMSSLRIASGLGGSVAVIDTEFGSSEKYSDRFEFDISVLDTKRGIDQMVAALAEAGEAGYEIVIIDSLTHAWQELLEEIDQLAKTKYKGNTWSAWSEGTPKQKKLVRAVLSYPGHLLATMRSKTAWETEKTKDGGNRPVKIGLAPEQGKGIEYEFDMLVELTVEHYATVTKDRTGKFQDQIIEKPGEDFGRELIAWLSSGEAAAAPRQRGEIVRDIVEVYKQDVFSDDERKKLKPRLAKMQQNDELENYLQTVRDIALERREAAEKREDGATGEESRDAEPEKAPSEEAAGESSKAGTHEAAEDGAHGAAAGGDQEDLDIF